MGPRRRGHVLPLFLPRLEGLSPVVRAHPGTAPGAALVELAPQKSSPTCGAASTTTKLQLWSYPSPPPAAAAAAPPDISCPSCACWLGAWTTAEAGRTTTVWNRDNSREQVRTRYSSGPTLGPPGMVRSCKICKVGWDGCTTRIYCGSVGYRWAAFPRSWLYSI